MPAHYGSTVPEDQQRQMAARYLEGWSLRQIEQRMGWAATTVRLVLMRCGVELRPRGGRNRVCAS